MQAYFPEYVIDYWFNDGFVIVKFRDDTVTNLYDAMLQEDGFFDFYKANDRLVIDAVAFYERVGKEFLEQMREAPDGEDEQHYEREMQEYIPKYFPLHIVDYCFDKGQVIIKFVTCDFAKKYAEDLEEDKFYDFYLSKDKLIINTVAFCEQIGREFW